MFEYNVEVLRVVDADTLTVLVDLGFRVRLKVDVRLDRINAHEVSTPRGIVARAYVQNLIASTHQVRIVSRRQEKYGRWLAEVNVQGKPTDAEWLNLNDDLVRHSHAVYRGYG